MAFHCLPRPLLAWPHHLHAWHSPSPSPSSKDWHSSSTDLFPRSPSPFSQVVKVEPQDDPADGCFIIENPTADLHLDPLLADSKVASFVSSQALAPPTEVPLRATQAPKRMKGMMGVFRINPFAMHNGSEGKGSAPTVGWEPGPLEEEPVMFEFQLDLIGYGDSDDDDDDDDGDVDDAGQGGGGGGGGSGGSPADLAITWGAGGDIEAVFPRGRQVDPDVKLSSTTTTAAAAALHAFSPDFGLHDEFVGASKRYTGSPSGGGGISQGSLPEDQAQSVASCTDNTSASALLPPGNQRGGSPFAFEYQQHPHHHHHQQQQQRSRSVASPCTFVPPMRSDGTWDQDVGTVDMTALSSEDRPLHVQNTSSGEVDGEEQQQQQHYHHHHQHHQQQQVAVVHPHSQHPVSTTGASVAGHAVHYDESVGMIEASNNCSYPSMVTQQTSGYVVTAVPDVSVEDPSQLGYPTTRMDGTQTHTVAAFDGLGMYGIPSVANGSDTAGGGGGGGGGRVQVSGNSSPCMAGVVVPSATSTHIASSPTGSGVGVGQNVPVQGCAGMRYTTGRNNSHHHHNHHHHHHHRLYDAHHHQYHQHYTQSHHTAHAHPYLRPLSDSSQINKLIVDRQPQYHHHASSSSSATTRDCATYSDYSEEYEYEYDENRATTVGVQQQGCYEPQEYGNATHLLNHHHQHQHQQQQHHQHHHHHQSVALSAGAMEGTDESSRLWAAGSTTSVAGGGIPPRQQAFTLLEGRTS